MNTMRGYFLFFSFMISMVLWDAMNKTLGATDIADAHSASAAGYWIVAILITIVFVVGLIAMKRSGATPKTEPPNQANGILLFSLMIYALAEQNHITTAIKQ
ncbi:MAG: hypothetical protein JWQ02_3615, partial [Capsulimonas sp.]|nr:hypothetical protein [Capsulimonas sp.]